MSYFKYDKREEEFSVGKNEEVCAVYGLLDPEILRWEEDEETSWVECDACKQWFHLACLGVGVALNVLRKRKCKCKWESCYL